MAVAPSSGAETFRNEPLNCHNVLADGVSISMSKNRVPWQWEFGQHSECKHPESPCAGSAQWKSDEQQSHAWPSGLRRGESE